MLVLSRHIDQRICINGHEIIVQVVDIRGDKVRLGIQAPPHMTVHREEIQQRIDSDRQEARGYRAVIEKPGPGARVRHERLSSSNTWLPMSAVDVVNTARSHD